MRIILTTAMLLAASAVFAQTSAWVEVDDDRLMVSAIGATVDEVEDMRVYDAGGQEIGEVEEVLGTARDRPTALSVEADDYLGRDGDDVVIALDQLKLEGGRLTTILTKEQVAALPRWDD
ncbi:MAG: PRC-barrel domain-containing protein [Shinella sp.]|nr:PRC-barrel domain-containing protein [Shinella sp.]